MSKQLIDMHFHSSCSDDAKGTVLENLKQAKEKNMTMIGFSNHLEYLNSDIGKCDINPKRDIERHLKTKNEINLLKDQFSNMEILFGLELENKWEYKTEAEEVIDAVKPDFLINSVHMIGEDNISSEKGLNFLKTNVEEKVYNSYFDEFEKMIDWGLGKIVGHFDLVKRFGTLIYGPFDHKKYGTRIENIVKEVKRKKMFFEFNCSGLFQHPKETYPSDYFFEYLREAQINRVSVGSDSHKPTNLGRGVEETIDGILKRDFEIITSQDLLD